MAEKLSKTEIMTAARNIYVNHGPKNRAQDYRHYWDTNKVPKDEVDACIVAVVDLMAD